MKYIVTFAGPIGSSKSPIAHYLSQKFFLPILSNDVIRTEVIEDLGIFNEKEFRKRANHRAVDLMKLNQSFIFDASVDRQWPNFKNLIDEYQYSFFIISLDISYPFLQKIHNGKGYINSESRLKTNYTQHQDFKTNFSQLISLSINDQNFSKRLSVSQQSLKNWLKTNGSKKITKRG